MRKNWFYIFLLMATVAMPFTSCSNDDDAEPMPNEEEQKHDPESDEDQIPIDGYDALDWLQGCLVVVDENNEVVRRIYGKPLDESQPTVLSVPVSDYESAEKIFLGWVAPDKEADQVKDGYDYNLSDEEGNAQGGVSFRAVADEAGVVARMTLAPGTDLKQVSEVNFVDADFWPENVATDRYEAGKIYEIKDYVLKWKDDFTYYKFDTPKSKTVLPFYCVQGNDNGKEAILVWLSPDADDGRQHPRPYYYFFHALKYLATPAEAEKVLEFYNNNNAFWNNMLKEMDAKGYEWSAQKSKNATGNSEFMINKWKQPLQGVPVIYCLDLDKPKGEMDWALVEASYFQYRYMHIRIYPPATNW